jgi:hypothetical protein
MTKQEQQAIGIQNGIEAVAETRAIMERKGLKLNKGLKKLKDLMEAQKTVSAVSGKDAGAGTVDFVDVPDNPTQIKALDMFFRLRGDYPAEKKDVKHTGNVSINVVNYADTDGNNNDTL